MILDCNLVKWIIIHVTFCLKTLSVLFPVLYRHSVSNRIHFIRGPHTWCMRLGVFNYLAPCPVSPSKNYSSWQHADYSFQCSPDSDNSWKDYFLAYHAIFSILPMPFVWQLLLLKEYNKRHFLSILILRIRAVNATCISSSVSKLQFYIIEVT